MSQTVVVGQRFHRPSYALRTYLERNHVPFTWHDADSIDGQRVLVEWGSPDALPVVRTQDGQVHVTPDLRTIAHAVGLDTQPSHGHYDLAIVGAGPAGLAAAIYGASEGLDTVVIDADSPGGQAGTTSRIENFLGFPDGLSGHELAQRSVSQALRLGAEVVAPRRVAELAAGTPHTLTLDDGHSLDADAVILANGVTWRKLNVPSIDRYIGAGVYYGFSMSEARNCKGLDVAVIGGGNSAGQSAMYLADYAKRVTVLVRGDGLSRDMSAYLIDQLQARDNVVVLTNTEATGATGGERLQGLELSNGYGLPVSAVFVSIGAVANNGWLPAGLLRDRRGFIVTGEPVEPFFTAAREHYQYETSLPGVFAVGDVRHGSVKRIAGAVGEGSVVVSSVHKFLAS